MNSVLEMAGVGIFFQQEPMTGKVYVANIVPGGSADRSGVIRVNDVIVKVDEEKIRQNVKYKKELEKFIFPG